jgi:UDP-N-acetylmuramoyl-L-alanyl-D-glutamate--2,6-diaminopimelate ligase
MTFNVSQITGITADSRKVEAGNLFVALSGTKQDGRAYIADAIAKGAKFIVAENGTPHQPGAEWMDVDNSHRFLSLAAAAFYKLQPAQIVAVTGTNGKTSTVNFVRMIWELLGVKAVSLGTLGLTGKGLDSIAGMTTPDPVSLFSTLAEVSKKGFTHLAMEASSHGLQQYRLDGVRVQAAGFSNLTRDHLDYHGTMDDYFQAKLRLFTEVVADNGTAVINADIPESAEIIRQSHVRGLTVLTYGVTDTADVRIVKRTAVAGGQDFVLSVFGDEYQVHLNLVGAFQAMNVLCAVGLVLAEKNVPVSEVMSALPRLDGVAGRLQPVPHDMGEFGIYVDYAHTPDGLETILHALRPHTSGRLICVFGCGGDRDKGKRPIMGEIATRLSDIAIVTDDNPRSEDPDAIRSEILAGAKNAIDVGGRRNAIHAAVKQLQAGDVLVIAGKGHEEGQIFANHTEPFNDFNEAQAAIRHFFS